MSEKRIIISIVSIMFALTSICTIYAEQKEVDFDPFATGESTSALSKSTSGPVIPQVEFNDNDISMVFQIISDATGWSIFPTSDVSKAKINLWAKNISAQQLFDTVITMAGFVCHREGDVITVMTYEEYMQYHGLERKVFQLQYGDAGKIKAAIEPFLSKIGKSEVHAETNTIILYESSANLEYITTVIHKLDIPLEEAVVAVIVLNYAKSESIAEMLMEVYAPSKESPQQMPNSTQAEANETAIKSTVTEEIMLQQRKIIVFPVEHSNQIVLVGSQTMVEKAQELISKVDIKGESLALEVIDLQFADAEVIEQTLQQMFKGTEREGSDKSPTVFANKKKTSSDSYFGNVNSEMLNPEAPVGIYAIGRTNQVIIKAFKGDMEVIKALITKLDTYIEPTTCNYHFSYVDVSEIYTGLERIMNIYAGYSSSTGSSFSRGNGQSNGPGRGRTGITLVEKSNSILLTAPPSAHRIMESIKKSIDTQSTFETGMIRVYKIENADVEEVAQTIEGLLKAQQEDEADSSQVKFKNASPSTGPEGDLSETGQVFTKIQTSVSVSSSTNSVVVMATARQHRELEGLIKELDKRRKQVLIEAKIVEITVTDDFDFGVELGYADNTASLFTFFDLSSNLDPDTATRNPIVNSGGTATLLDPDKLQMILHAVKTDGNIRINSAPQILVNDNAVGFINSISEEPYTTTTQGENSDKTSFGGFVEAGTQFAITPHISKQDYLRVEYQITLNSFTDDSSDPSIPPPRSTNTIQSEATVPNGYTIVVGGLKTSDEIEAVSKFPILGDMPIIDLLFKRTTTEKTNKMVFLFITPNIMEEENFSDLKNATGKVLDEVAEKNKSMIQKAEKKQDNKE